MFDVRLKELVECLEKCTYTTPENRLTKKEALQLSHKLLLEAQQRKGIVYVIGNGGSAGIASHFCNDLMKSLKIPSQTLYDTNLLTCLANDIGYENVFSYSLERLLKPKDLLIAISSSGKSRNILNAVHVAKTLRTPVITFSGFEQNNELRALGQLNFWIDRKDYGIVEMSHFFLLHTIADTWNKEESDYAQIIRNLGAKKDFAIVRDR